MEKKHVVIIGCGFGGLSAVKRLNSKDLKVTLIDRTNHHLFQPLLYQVATAGLSASEIAHSTRRILRNQKNTEILMAEVIAIHKEDKKVELGDGEMISYDYLILAPGARHSYFGNDQWEEHAPGLKSLDDAIRIREEILLSFEKAEHMAYRGGSPEEAVKKCLNFVVVGGGPTGVEMAGAIAEIARTTMYRNFRRIKPEQSRIILLEGADRLLSMFPASLSERAKKDLTALGVEVILGARVTNITSEGVQVGEIFIPSQNVIWAAGNASSPLLKTLNLPADQYDRSGRVLVEPDLSIKNYNHIFVIGDSANLAWKPGIPCPATAPFAIQGGAFVAHNIKCHIPPEKRTPFVYHDKGSMATVGKSRAVGMYKKVEFTGFIAWLGWCFVHIAYLIGFRNRIRVLMEWLIVFITGQRGVRLIYKTIRTPKK